MFDLTAKLEVFISNATQNTEYVHGGLV